MYTYKIEISLRGRLVTPLMGDTIFGHLVWGINRHEGEESTAKFIESLPENPLVVSNAFPHGFLPKPIIVDSNMSSMNIGKKNIDYATLKKEKKIKYIPKEVLLNKQSITKEILIQSVLENKTYNILNIERLRNTCDRLGNGTLEETGLYEVEETWFENLKTKSTNILFDIYIVTNYDMDVIRKYITWAFECGYGADATVGAGNIQVNTIEKVQFPENGNRAMALGNFVLQDERYEDLKLYANTITKRGKVGDYFTQIMNPFKKPVIFFTEGSTFNPNVLNNLYIGSVIYNIHKDKRIVQQGWAPIIKFNEVLE